MATHCKPNYRNLTIFIINFPHFWQLKTFIPTKSLHSKFSLFKQKKIFLYLKAKEELWKFKYFTMQKYINCQKNPLKRNQNPSRYYNFVTILKFQHKSKYHLSKNPHIKIDLLLLLLLPRGL
jgi:hypothetical protein